MIGSGFDVVAPVKDQVVPAESDRDFFRSRADARPKIMWADREEARLLQRLVRSTEPLRQDAFYPLAAALFTAIGHPARLPARGDTSNRIDLLLVDDEDTIPVEVKSPTESVVINVKAVQQALENRVVIDQRSFHPAIADSSSLVLGYKLPPVRSDVTELVRDISNAFGVRVGLLCVGDLYRAVLKIQLAGKPFPRKRLAQLLGVLA